MFWVMNAFSNLTLMRYVHYNHQTSSTNIWRSPFFVSNIFSKLYRSNYALHQEIDYEHFNENLNF